MVLGGGSPLVFVYSPIQDVLAPGPALPDGVVCHAPIIAVDKEDNVRLVRKDITSLLFCYIFLFANS